MGIAAAEALDAADLSHAWQELIDQLHESERSLQAWRGDGPLDPVDLAEGYRFILHQARYAIDLMLESDPERPHFGRMADEITKMFGDNADAIYHFTNISGASGAEYRIVGNRGDACYLSFQSHHGPDRGNPMQVSTDDINFRRIDFAPDGAFEVKVGGAPQPRNWLGLAEDATCVIVRGYYFDVPHDRPATYKIEPVKPVAPPAPWTPGYAAARLRSVNTFIKFSEVMRPKQVKLWNEFEAPFQFTRAMPGWGTPDNAYCRCFFRLADDEALVIEGDAVPAVYWNLQLWNIHSQTLDFRYFPICLNSKHAKIGADGRFRAVIAHSDPGVPNWLNTAGHRIGFVFNRWLLADKLPTKPTANVVKLSELKQR